MNDFVLVLQKNKPIFMHILTKALRSNEKTIPLLHPCLHRTLHRGKCPEHSQNICAQKQEHVSQGMDRFQQERTERCLRRPER